LKLGLTLGLGKARVLNPLLVPLIGVRVPLPAGDIGTEGGGEISRVSGCGFRNLEGE
jgi:hypothetical protein